MAFSKNRRLADLITVNAQEFITSSHITDTAITHADLHTNMDLTGKTVLVANASTGDSDTTAANTAFVQQELAALVDSAPGTLNTLNELAAALGDDASFSTTVTNSIATKLPLAGGTLTGDLILGDNVKVEIGSASGGDLQLFHDTNNSHITSVTGQFFLTSSNSNIWLRGTEAGFLTADGSEYLVRATSNGSVKLYHNNAIKLETATGGVTVTGNTQSTSFTAGTANPNAELLYLLGSGHTGHGASNTVSLASIAENTSGNTMGLWIGSMTNENTGVIGSRTASGNIAFQTYSGGWGERMRITSGGNVGIGTGSPNGELEVNKTTAGGLGGRIVIRNSASNSGSYCRLYLSPTANDPEERGTVIQGENVDGNNNMAMVFKVSAGASPTERMRITSGGNVGIGDAPSSFANAALHVAKDMGSSVTAVTRLRGRNTTARTTRLQFEDYSGTIADGLIDFHFPNAGSHTGAYFGMGYNAGNQLAINSSGNVGIGTTNPFAKLQVVNTGWSSGVPYGSIVHIDGGSNHDNNWGHLHVNQNGTSANIGGRIRLGTAANNGYGGNPIAGITALNKDTANGTYGNLEFSTRPSGGTNQMRMELSHNGHIKLSGDHGIRVFTGYFGAGTTTTSFNVAGYGAGVMKMTAAFNHYGFISSYGCFKHAICSNGPGHGGTSIQVNDLGSEITSGNGGSWTFHRNSGDQTSYKITKNAGTYAGGGYYWVRFEGNMGV